MARTACGLARISIVSSSASIRARGTRKATVSLSCRRERVCLARTSLGSRACASAMSNVVFTLLGDSKAFQRRSQDRTAQSHKKNFRKALVLGAALLLAGTGAALAGMHYVDVNSTKRHAAIHQLDHRHHGGIHG